MPLPASGSPPASAADTRAASPGTPPRSAAHGADRKSARTSSGGRRRKMNLSSSATRAGGDKIAEGVLIRRAPLTPTIAPPPPPPQQSQDAHKSRRRTLAQLTDPRFKKSAVRRVDYSVTGRLSPQMHTNAPAGRPGYTGPAHGGGAQVPPPPATAAEALGGEGSSRSPNAASGAPTRAAATGANAEPSATYQLGTTEVQRAVYAALDKLMSEPIPELQQPAEVRSYEEASLESTLYEMIEKHDVIMVAGAFFGDEGKGKTVDAVARHPKCTTIARTNSGENAGHTVYDRQGRKFVFNLAPSGLLTPGKRNYVGPECVMDPVSFMEKEVKQLVDAGIAYHDTLFLGNTCIVTPYHKLLDLLGSAKNASTLKGMAPVHASKVTKRGIRLDHIFNDEATLRSRLAKDMETYFGLLKVKGLSDADVVKRCVEENSDGVIRVPDYVVEFARAKDKVSYLVDLYRTRVRENPAFPPRCDVVHEIRAAILRGEKVLLEGPQSYWLSNAREKFWGSTTSADTSAAGLLATAQLNFQQFRYLVINVHKAPASSRVGIGACPSSFVPQDFFSSQDIKTLNDLPPGMCTNFEAIQKLYFTEAFKNVGDAAQFKGIAEPVEYTDETGTYNIGVAMAVSSAIHHGECGAVTKKPRICGLFDCVLQHEVSASQGPYLSISALDRGDDYDKVGITIAYIYYSPDNVEVDVSGRKYRNGDIIKAGDPVPGEAALFNCYPIVKLVDGWKDSPIAAKTRTPGTPFPAGLCQFLSTVEHFGSCKVLSIGNGPKGEDIIYLRQ